MIRSFPAGLIAAAAFAFVAPLAASAKGYQPSMVDSTAIEGQFLIAGAGNKDACEKKGKSWKAKTGWQYQAVHPENLTGSTDDRNNWCNIKKMFPRSSDPERRNNNPGGFYNTDLCSCQK